MTSVNHIGLTVADLDESLAFYREVVGMKDVYTDLKMGGEWFDQLTENRGAVIRVAQLELEGVNLQLVEYTEAKGERLPLLHRNVGNPHICLNSTGVAERHAAMSAAGRYKVSPLVTIADTGTRSFYVTDPNGVLVEFIEARQ